MPVAQGDQNKAEAAQGAEQQPKTAAGRLAAKRAAKAAEKAKKRAATPMPAEIAAGVEAARSWFDTHSAALWIGLAALVSVGAGVVGASRYLRDTQARESALLLEAVETASAPIIAAGEEVPEGVDESFPTAEERSQKVLEAARKAQKALSGAALGWSVLTEGNALAQLGKHAEAKKAYERVLATADDAASLLRYRALEGAAFMLEVDQKYGEAAARFDQIGALDGGAYKLPAEYHKARMLIAQGDKQKASQLLDALLKAEAKRPASEAKRFEDIVSSAETLINELAVALDEPKLRSVPASAGAHGSSADIMNMIRSQLKGGKGEPSLDDKQLEQLVHQLDKGGSAPANAPAPAGGNTK